MKLNAFILGALLFAAIFLAGCSKEMNNEELYLKIIEANSNLNSYSANLSMSINMLLDTSEQKMNVSSTMETGAYINRADKQLYMRGQTTSVFSVPNSSVETEDMDIKIDSETYVIDNYLYTKIMGMWVKIELSNDIWSQQDTLESSIELLKNSSMEILKDESFNGESYYVIKVEPSMDALTSALAQQEQLGLSDVNISFGEIIKEYSVKMWINKKTLIVEKSETSVKMVFSLENTGNNEKDESKSVEMQYAVKVELSDINKEVAITLPDEAKKAIDMTSLYGNIDQNSEEAKGSSSITGNVIAEVLSS